MEVGGFIGPYRLEEPVGEGGMGSVWKARHPTLDRQVAIKLIRSEVQASPQAREAFLREVRVLSRLHGPQILQVMDFGFTDRGDPYMVTEFLDGEDLLARVRRAGPMPAAEAVEVGIEVLKALAEAHAVGLVHRDLKPGNVFLQRLAGGARTAVKVLDFGVAKLLEADDEDTLWPEARLKGSPRYMAPEQVQGGEISPATDLYAFGATMYRVLTGKPVFTGERTVVLRAHVEAPPRPMRERAPQLDIPRELDDLVLDCLEKDPAERPGSTAALQARLERLARRLQEAREASGDDRPITGALSLDWSAVSLGGEPEAGGGSDPGGSGSGLGGWGVPDPPAEPEPSPASSPEPARPSAPDLGAWFSTTGELSGPREPSPPPPSPAPSLELADRPARPAPTAGVSMAGVEVPTGGIELPRAPVDDGLQLAFEPSTRGAGRAPDPPPAPETADPPPDDPPADAAVPDRPDPYRPAASVQIARVERAPWHVEHRAPLIAAAAVFGVLLLVWIGRAAFIADADETPAESEAAIADAGRPRLDVSVPVILDRGVGLTATPAVARGPAASEGAPDPADTPTVLVKPDPGPATFVRVSDGEVICEDTRNCRVPIDVDVRVIKRGFRPLTLSGDDLYDRRGSTWRVILRR